MTRVGTLGIPPVGLLLALAGALAGGCIEIPEYQLPGVPEDLGSALDEEPSNCSPGTFECACRPDASCNAGLACVDGICEAPGSTTGDGDGDTTTGDGDGDGDPTTTTGDGDGDPTTTTGDGDGDPTTTTGDGDPTTGDGDGDLTTGDGDGDPLPGCVDDLDCPFAHFCNNQLQCELAANLAFVTNQAFAPDFGGLAGADQLCQTAADNAGLAGNFVALLIDSNNPDFQARLQGANGWLRTDLRYFLGLASNLFDNGQIFYPLTFDEFGNDLGPVDVFTGGVESLTCADWTSADPNEMAGIGNSGAGAWGFLDSDLVSCAEVSAHLYCLQIDRDWWEESPPTPPAFRRAFLSIQSISGAAGTAAMDALCQSEASQAGLAPNNEPFVAWLAKPGSAPNEVLDLGGPPWLRPDNVALVDDAADLADANSFLAPLNVDAFVGYNSAWVWTGADGPEALGQISTTCNNWSVTDEGGSVGVAHQLGQLFGPDIDFCGAEYRLYCMQQ